MPTRTIRYGLAAMSAALLALAAPARAAENHDATGPTVKGVVSDVSGSTVKLLSGLIAVDTTGATIVAESDDAPLTAADVKVGSLIEADGSMVGQLFHATMIRVHGPRSDGAVSGPIDSVDAAGHSFSVLGLTVAFNQATAFGRDNGAASGPADLAAGKVVEVEVAVFQGKLVATRISFSGGDTQAEHSN